MNTVSLIGRLVKDLDLRYTQSGKAVATGTLAVNRRFKNASGESEADFIQIQIWDKAGENMANFTRKGSLVGIEGSIQTRNYDNQQGNRVYVTEVVVDNFTLLEPKQTTEQRPRENTYKQPDKQEKSMDASKTGDYKYNSFDELNKHPDPFTQGEGIDIEDDDLPF